MTDKKPFRAKRRDITRYRVQDDVDVVVFWKVLRIGRGPAIVLEISGREIMKFDCFGEGRGHFHIQFQRYPQTHEGRIFFSETFAFEQVDRSVFELRTNLDYYLQRNPDPRLRELTICRPALESACERARIKMLEFLDRVPELQELRPEPERPDTVLAVIGGIAGHRTG